MEPSDPGVHVQKPETEIRLSAADVRESAPPYLVAVIRSLVLLVIGSVLFATALLYPFPVDARIWGPLFDLAHAPSFCVGLLVVAGLLDPQSVGLAQHHVQIIRLNPLRLLVLGLAVMMLGVLSEIVQHFVGRSASVGDALANSAGVMSALLWCAAIRTRRSQLRGLTVAGAVLLIAAPAVNPMLELRECYLQVRQFPLLASFERELELGAWFPRHSDITVSQEWSSHGRSSMKVVTEAGRFPGTAMIWPVPDWSSYHFLELDLFNPGTEPLSVGMTIADRQHTLTGYESEDRFNTAVTVPAESTQSVTIKLSDVCSAPENREMVMHDIVRLNLFVSGQRSGTVLYVDNIRLTEKAP